MLLLRGVRHLRIQAAANEHVDRRCSKLNTQPTCTPIYASLHALRHKVQESRPIATLFEGGSFILWFFTGLSGTQVPRFGTVTSLEIGPPIDRISNRLL